MGLGFNGPNAEPSDPESRDHQSIHLINRAPSGAHTGESNEHSWIRNNSRDDDRVYHHGSNL
jgi:hypothetical protein